MTATSTTLTVSEAVEEARSGQSIVIRCPAHDDGNPSLSVSPGKEQDVVLKCFAGCENADILAAEGLTWADVCAPMEDAKPKQNLWTPAGDATNIYPYYDAHGSLSYEVLRAVQEGKKRFFQRRPDANEKSGYKWNLDGVERLLYRLPQVLEAVNTGQTIHIAEGEKCVESLMRVLPSGQEATCNSGGAGRWKEEFSEVLAGATCIVYADSDEVGRDHAAEVRESLVQHGCKVRIMEAPAGLMATGKSIHDIADHIDAGLGFGALLETTPESGFEKARSAVDIHDITSRPEYTFEWVIEGTLARSERMILVAGEGAGKSQLLRQMAVCVAAGIHPFTLREQTPRRVLFIDGENHPGQVQGSWKNLAHLMNAHGRPLQPGMMHVLEEWDAIHDITSDKGQRWLMERVHAYKPDLLVVSPIYELMSGSISSEEVVNSIRRTIDATRGVSECAILMEHHAPQRMGGDKTREMRPVGSSVFLRWPDFGAALQPTEKADVFEFGWWRGGRVRGRHWPEALRWGKPGTMELPFMETTLDVDGGEF